MHKQRVQVYVQDYSDQFSQKGAVENTDEIVRNFDKTRCEFSSPVISPETWENWFCQWLDIMQDDVPPASAYEIGLRLTDDREIQNLNSQYRHQDKPTDVLAFAATEVDSPHIVEIGGDDEPLYLGDIAVSVNTARKQAIQQGHSLKTELAWLASHGLLHLIGWDHPDEESLQRMMRKQVILLKTVSIDINIK